MDMSDITGLIRSGKLGQATDAIQRRLGGGRTDSAGDGPRGAARPHAGRHARVRRDRSPARRRAAPPAPAVPRSASAGRTERLPGPMAPLLTHPAMPAEEGAARRDAAWLHADPGGLRARHPGWTRSPARTARTRSGPDRRARRTPTGAGTGSRPPIRGRAARPRPWRPSPRRCSAGRAPIPAACTSRACRRAARWRPSWRPRAPDLVASIGIHSGLGAGAASDMPSAFAAMGGRGAALTALEVPAIVIHGDADRTVVPANAAAIAAAGRTGGSPPPATQARHGGRAPLRPHHDPGRPPAPPRSSSSRCRASATPGPAARPRAATPTPPAPTRAR